MKTIVCGVDGSPRARVALRVAAALADELGARLVAVHVLDRLADAGPTSERLAAGVLYDEIPDAAPRRAVRSATWPERAAGVGGREGRNSAPPPRTAGPSS